MHHYNFNNKKCFRKEAFFLIRNLFPNRYLTAYLTVPISNQIYNHFSTDYKQILFLYVLGGQIVSKKDAKHCV